MRIDVEFEIDLISSANVSGTTRSRMSRTKRHRESAYYHVLSKSRELGIKPFLPCTVTLTRVGIKELDSHDNVRHAFKHIVDGISLFLGVKDKDKQITWVYNQELCEKSRLKLPRSAIVRIVIEPTNDQAPVTSRRLLSYLAMERAVALLREGKAVEEVEEEMGSAMDHLWFDMPREERNLLDRRDPKSP